MALVKEDAVQRVEVHDGWVDVRAAATVGQLMGIAGDSNLSALANPTADVLHAMLREFIVAWSYDDPVSPENIKLLDMDATTSILEVINEKLGASEKKGRKLTPSAGENGRKS